jgi:glycosyltransferase involved in cell wall biosynthesis
MGGPQRRFIQIANAFGSRYRHTIIAMDGRMDAAEQLAQDVRFGIHSLPVAKGGGLSLGNLNRIARTLRSLQPAMLLTYNWGSIEWLLANRLLGWMPHLHFEDGFGPEEAGGRQLPRRVWTRRLSIGGQTAAVVPSRTLATIARETWRIPAKRLHYIPNGIELARFAAARPLRLPFSPDRLVIGSVGALRAEKNLGRLLRLLDAVRDLPVVLVICGEGPERTRLEAEARRLQLAERVHFTGHCADPAPAYAAFDLFALTSDTEQMPYSVIEAMAAGLPVLATDVGDVRSMLALDHARDCTAAPDDEAGLALKLRRLLESKNTRAETGSANQSHARVHFGIDTMLEAYDRLFRDKIGQTVIA